MSADLRYQESHEWAREEGGVVTVGITAFAVEHLSDLTFLDLPEVGTAIDKGERFGEIESVKAVSELMSPVSGEVVEINEPLVDAVETVAQDPMGAGWMIKIKATNLEELGSLMDAEAYARHIESES